MTTPYLAHSTAELIEWVVKDYIPKGYYFYAPGLTPHDDDPVEFDREILDQIEASKWALHGQKGQADVQYLRFNRLFLIAATEGFLSFLPDQAERIKDIRKTSLGIDGHEINCLRSRGGKCRASVRIHPEYFAAMMEKYVRLAATSSAEDLGIYLLRLGRALYPTVREELGIVLQAVNRKRKVAGLEIVPRTAIGLKQAPVKPFKPKVQ